VSNNQEKPPPLPEELKDEHKDIQLFRHLLQYPKEYAQERRLLYSKLYLKYFDYAMRLPFDDFKSFVKLHMLYFWQRKWWYIEWSRRRGLKPTYHNVQELRSKRYPRLQKYPEIYEATPEVIREYFKDIPK